VSITITTLGGELAGKPRSALTPAAVFTYEASTLAPCPKRSSNLV
jgi:hypothetical protein